MFFDIEVRENNVTISVEIGKRCSALAILTKEMWKLAHIFYWVFGKNSDEQEHAGGPGKEKISLIRNCKLTISC